MKEIYIVTSGCYSDYGIDEVFSDKEKAEEYVKLRNGKNKANDYGYRVETFGVDTAEFDSVRVVEVVAKKLLNKKDEYEFELDVFETIKNTSNKVTNVDIIYRGDLPAIRIKMTRPINNRSIDQLENTYRKVVQDYFFMIESNLEYYKSYDNRWDLCKQLNTTLE